jgi:hypothetical protein
LAEREAELLPVSYFHVVFSLPAKIADIAYQNKAAIYDILFKTAAETMITIAADPKHLGARVGVLSVLHTWGSALNHHPHVHMIVPGGGISLDGERWVACRPDFLLYVGVLSRLFRRPVLEKLTAAHRAGALQFFSKHAALANTRAFAAYLAPLRNSEWAVYCKRPFGGPEEVLRYLARYTWTLSPDKDRARREDNSKFQRKNECLSCCLERNQMASVSAAWCARLPLRPCPFNFFSNIGRGNGAVISRSDMDGRLSSER